MQIEKDQLKKLGEETIYSAKGHFKACDLRRNLITITIWGCAILNVIGLFGINNLLDKIFSAIGLFGTIALLIWNEGEGRDYKSQHKKVAEGYLNLHKEIRELYFKENLTATEYSDINIRVRAFDNSEKPDIPIAARKWAQLAIKKHNETDNWFNNGYK